MIQLSKRNESDLVKLQQLLRELFQFDLSDLDFGIYKIFRIKQDAIRDFIDVQLPASINAAFDIVKVSETEALVERLALLGDRIRREIDPSALSDDGSVADEFRQLKVMSARSLIAEYEEIRTALLGSATIDADKSAVFSHLYNFFSRYYDSGDFIARRFYGTRPSYAIPYNGSEINYYWANKGQHYVKTTENFTDYGFVLDALGGPYNVRFVVTEVAEVKDNANSQRRYFIPLAEHVAYDEANKTIRVPFAYVERDRLQEHGIDKQSADLMQDAILSRGAEKIILAIPHADIASALSLVVNASEMETSDSKPVTLLLKRLRHFARRNASDYFIHRDLRGFLQEELDFYLKDQFVQVADNQADSQSRRQAIDVFRRLSGDVISLLAQIEDLQLCLFEKPKFAVTTEYLVAVGALPRSMWRFLLDATCEKQLAEWQTIYEFDKAADLLGWSGRITEAFLEQNPSLMLRTNNFAPSFKEELLCSFSDIQGALDGMLVSAESYQALRFAMPLLRQQIKTCYIDPPYNRGTNDFIYKDRYRHSSWAAMMAGRLDLARETLRSDGVIFVSIDENERTTLEHVLDEEFGRYNRVEELIWTQNTTHSQSPAYSTNHEYVEVYARNKVVATQDPEMFREPKPGYSEIRDLVSDLNSSYPRVDEIESAIKDLMASHLADYKLSLQERGLSYDKETKKQDPWAGIYLYKRAEYRDAHGRYVPESEAQERQAEIWVWQDADASAPANKQSPSTSDENDPNYRFYTPPHPLTKKPTKHPKSGWRWPFSPIGSRESFSEYDCANRIVWGKDEKKVPRFKRFLHEVETNVAKSVMHVETDGERQLTKLFGRTGVFPNPKPTSLIRRFIMQTCREGEWVADFFAGSGTTVHAALEASTLLHGRVKFFAAEMANHFHDVMLPRIMKVAFTPHWRNGVPSSVPIGMECAVRPRLIKVLELETYDDALHNLCSDRVSAREIPRAVAVRAAVGDAEYRSKHLFQLLIDVSPTMLQPDLLEHPFEYKLNIRSRDGRAERNVDIVETFNAAVGLTVRSMRIAQSPLDHVAGQPRRYLVSQCIARDGATYLIIWRDMAGLRPALERSFLSELPEVASGSFERLLINGDSAVPGFESLDPLFKEVMSKRGTSN